jgi:predicted nucleic acid-binding OB-fold protein
MKYTVSIQFGNNSQSVLQEEKLKFLRGSLESLNINVSDWDMTCSYDVDLRVYLRQMFSDNSVIVNEENDYIKITKMPSTFIWKVVEKYVSKKENKFYTNFVIQTEINNQNQG